MVDRVSFTFSVKWFEILSEKTEETWFHVVWIGDILVNVLCAYNCLLAHPARSFRIKLIWQRGVMHQAVYWLLVNEVLLITFKKCNCKRPGRIVSLIFPRILGHSWRIASEIFRQVQVYKGTSVGQLAHNAHTRAHTHTYTHTPSRLNVSRAELFQTADRSTAGS